MTSSTRPRAIQKEAADVARPQASAVTAAWILIAIVGLGSFAVMTWLLWRQVQIPFDQPLLDTARGWTAFTGAWDFLSNAANYPLIVLGIGTILWLFLRGERRQAILVTLVLAAATAGSEAVKQLVSRPRPPGNVANVPGVIYSYPSGHVLECVTVLGIIAVLLWRSHAPSVIRVGYAIAVGIFTALVAVARVAINAHYPSDVLAGFLAGIGVLAVFVLLTQPRHRSPPGERASADRTDAEHAHHDPA